MRGIGLYRSISGSLILIAFASDRLRELRWLYHSGENSSGGMSASDVFGLLRFGMPFSYCNSRRAYSSCRSRLKAPFMEGTFGGGMLWFGRTARRSTSGWLPVVTVDAPFKTPFGTSFEASFGTLGSVMPPDAVAFFIRLVSSGRRCTGTWVSGRGLGERGLRPRMLLLVR